MDAVPSSMMLGRDYRWPAAVPMVVIAGWHRRRAAPPSGRPTVPTAASAATCPAGDIPVRGSARVQARSRTQHRRPRSRRGDRARQTGSHVPAVARATQADVKGASSRRDRDVPPHRAPTVAEHGRIRIQQSVPSPAEAPCRFPASRTDSSGIASRPPRPRGREHSIVRRGRGRPADIPNDADRITRPALAGAET